MKNSKVTKILAAMLCLVMMFTISTPVFANNTNTDDGIGGVVINTNVPDSNVIESTQNVGNSILGLIRVVGILIAVGVIMVLGIKYMMGSAEEKAEYKKTLMPYLIGAVLLFAAATFAETIFDWASSL